MAPRVRSRKPLLDGLLGGGPIIEAKELPNIHYDLVDTPKMYISNPAGKLENNNAFEVWISTFFVNNKCKNIYLDWDQHDVDKEKDHEKKKKVKYHYNRFLLRVSMFREIFQNKMILEEDKKKMSLTSLTKERYTSMFL